MLLLELLSLLFSLVYIYKNEVCYFVQVMCILNTNPTLISNVLALKIDILLFVLVLTVDCYIIYSVLFERVIFFFSSEVSCPSSSLGMSLYLPLPQIHSILHYLIKPNPNCSISHGPTDI